MAAKRVPTTNKRSSSFTGKSKVISTSKMPAVRGGGTTSSGRRTVLPSKKM